MVAFQYKYTPLEKVKDVKSEDGTKALRPYVENIYSTGFN